MAAAPVPPPEGADQSGAQPGTFIDPYRSYNFTLDIPGVGESHFFYCSRLAVCIDSIAYREAGQTQQVHQIPGQVTYAYVTLKYGLTNSRALWDWLMLAVQGRVDRKNVTITLLDADGVAPVVHWNLISAWPKEWSGAPLDALGREIAIGQITLAFERIELG